MALFKCKMCGGALEINNNETVATCEYCGTQQTLPKLDDDRRANLYDRANHFRRNNEFDKAMGIYEKILNEDSTDAEAYWSLVLCRYGIEYVEDPSSHKRIPTVNRAQFTSIFDDDNYKSALQYADGYQRSIYEEEAKAINEIQKGILAISQKEEPFDVFICYKETDNNGRRTPDSVLANDLYHQLSQEGFKVFFARITLEDKLGSAYEPYIFAALNSAKVMVVLGTKPEYFNAVWVKNEWGRYLALIKNGEKKMLIPAYKDMDPYDLPEEFSHLQAQDMSKLGFMQDLIRGIKKIAQSDEPKTTVIKETVVATEISSNVQALLDRGFMALEDREWSKADEFFEQALNQNAKLSDAYLGKLLVELKIKTKDYLRDCAKPFDGSNNYKKTIRFADDTLKNELEGIIEYIKIRNENERLEGIYQKAVSKMQSATTEEEFLSAAESFRSIPDYKDSVKLADTCDTGAETIRKKAELKKEIERKNKILSSAKMKMQSDTVDSIEDAIKMFKSIPGWEDADAQVPICEKMIVEIKEKAEAERLERKRKAEAELLEAERIAKRNKKIAIITMSIVCAIIAFIIVLNTVIIPTGKYNDAIALMDAEKYTEAISAFEALDGYKDSEKKITECNTAILDGKYNDAITLMNAGNIIEAYEALVALDGYKDSADKASTIYDKYKVEYKVEKLKVAKVGDYVSFGAYEQDNNTSNGKEDIEWRVLEVKDGKALVISKDALDCQPYDTSDTDVTWETCTLRKWLNNDFINAAFSAYEKAKIPTVTVSADKNPKFSTNPGNATQDQVFLLSITEANKDYIVRLWCRPTDYAVAKGASVDSSYCEWWLRSPGISQDNAAYVYYSAYVHDGAVNEFGSDVNSDTFAVRPALWIDLNS